MLTTGYQLRAARSLVGMDQSGLADRVDLNVNTIRSMEASGTGPIAGRAVNVHAVQRALEAAGVEFIPENGGGAGVRLRKRTSLGDHPKPSGPATDFVEKMDAAIEEHRTGRKK